MKLLIVFLFLLFATSAQAATRYASPSGSGSTCSTGTPCTLATGLSQTASGDTLILKDGNYNSRIGQTDIASGSGSYASATIIRAENARGAVIRPIGGSGNAIAIGNNRSWIILQGIVIDGTDYPNSLSGQVEALWIGGDDSSTGAHHIKLDDVEIRNWNMTLSQFNRYSHDCWVVGGHYHNSDAPLGYGFYIVGRNHLFEYMEVDNNRGWGFHGISAYGGGQQADNTIVRYSRFHDNCFDGGVCEALLISGDNSMAYGNLIYSNYSDGIGVYGDSYPATNNKVYNNTVWNNGRNKLGYGGIVYGWQSTTTIQNNIIYADGNPTGDIVNTDVYPTPTFGGNFCGRGGAGCATTGNPSFVSTTSTNANFLKLNSGSPAIGAGVSLTGCPGAAWCTDLAGATRPRDGSWDAGAYEFVSAAVSCPSVPNALVASYDFEGNGNDSTGNGRTATLGSGWTYTTGHTGQGALSNGTSGITVADHDSLDPCAAFTYEGWINLPNLSGDYVFIVKNPASKAFLFASIYAYCGSGVPLAGYSETSQVAACSTTALGTGSFKHLAVTYDSTLPNANVKLYLNGVLVNTADGADLLSATTGTLQFCSSGFGETCPSGTVIDDVRIYNYARSASEIASSVTAPPVFTIKLQISSLKIGPSVSLKVGVP